MEGIKQKKRIRNKRPLVLSIYKGGLKTKIKWRLLPLLYIVSQDIFLIFSQARPGYFFCSFQRQFFFFLLSSGPGYFFFQNQRQESFLENNPPPPPPPPPPNINCLFVCHERFCPIEVQKSKYLLLTYLPFRRTTPSWVFY